MEKGIVNGTPTSTTWITLGLALVGLIVVILFWPLKGRAQLQTLTVEWTATGDDGNVGTATSYIMRYSPNKPDTTSVATMDTWWAQANTVSTMPTPLPAGTKQMKVLQGPFSAGVTYYVVMKICDEVPNCSPYSNVASYTVLAADVTAPGRLIDVLVHP